MSELARDHLKENGWKVAVYVKAQNLREITPTLFASRNSIGTDAAENSVGIDIAIELFPKTVAERIDRALINLASVTKSLGQDIYIGSEGANPLLLAQNTSEVMFIMRQLVREDYINGWNSGLPAKVVLTAKALMRAGDLERGLYGPLNKQVFVAMSFHDSLDAVWTDGLKLGIEDCGYTALRVDLKEHNEDICDVIIAEIRKSKFLVADFTFHKGGVYFEAGMMMGLSRPVIFTCRKDELGKAHFDTRQYYHIEWETPGELRERLKRRIQATIAP